MATNEITINAKLNIEGLVRIGTDIWVDAREVVAVGPWPGGGCFIGTRVPMPTPMTREFCNQIKSDWEVEKVILALQPWRVATTLPTEGADE